MSTRNTLLIVAALVTLIVLSGANLLLLLRGGDESAANGETPKTKETQAPATDPVFVRIGPLTVNLRSDRYGERLLYTTLSLRVENDESRMLINAYMPEIQSRLLMLLSSHSAEQLTTPEGKQQLAREALQALEPPFREGQAPLAVSAVLFTDFIVQ